MKVKYFLLKSWSGPFCLGPLTKPVAVGDVIMKILEVIWKFSVVGLCGFIALVPIAIFGSMMEDSYYRSRSPTDTRYTIADKVDRRVEYEGEGCKNPKPISVVLINKSQSDILKYEWRLSINQKGRSTNLIARDSVEPLI